jgi:hypothetical protein
MMGHVGERRIFLRRHMAANASVPGIDRADQRSVCGTRRLVWFTLRRIWRAIAAVTAQAGLLVRCRVRDHVYVGIMARDAGQIVAVPVTFALDERG